MLPPVGNQCADCALSDIESNSEGSASSHRAVEDVACAGDESAG